MLYFLGWVRPGSVTWEGWWVGKRGYTRGETPGLEQHVSFANYDLRTHGQPEIVLRDGRPSVEAGRSTLPIVLEIARRHGFELDDQGRGTANDPIVRELSAHAGPSTPSVTLVEFIENFYGLALQTASSPTSSTGPGTTRSSPPRTDDTLRRATYFLPDPD